MDGRMGMYVWGCGYVGWLILLRLGLLEEGGREREREARSRIPTRYIHCGFVSEDELFWRFDFGRGGCEEMLALKVRGVPTSSGNFFFLFFFFFLFLTRRLDWNWLFPSSCFFSPFSCLGQAPA